MGSDKTVQSMFNLFFWNFQNSSLQQFANLYHSTIAVLKYYNIKNKYEDDIEKILPKLFLHPIPALKEKYTDFPISKTLIDWSIPQLEWCYYRDTKFKSKLGKEYYPDTSKQQETKKILLSEVILILSFFKSELFARVVKILIDEKVDLLIQLPSGAKEIEQIQEQTK